jgi:hypothetical protein
VPEVEDTAKPVQVRRLVCFKLAIRCLRSSSGDEGWVTEWLAERPKEMVAFGSYPPFLHPSPLVALDGLIPNADGSVVNGIY